MGSYAYHLIFTTRNRLPRFADQQAVRQCLIALESSALRYGFRVLAYCFMPNHLHLLVAGDDGTPLVRFVQHFKQATGHRYPGLWQRSYYDRVLRREEHIEDVALYIWSNPVVAGLVADAAEYGFSGPREMLADTRRAASAEVEDRAKALSLRVP